MSYRTKNLAVVAAVLITLVMTGCRTFDLLRARDQLNKGVTAYEAKRYPEAGEHFQRSIELDPNLTHAYLYLAATYRAQFVPGAQSEENLQAAQRAIASYQEVLEKDPTNESAMASIANIHSGLENYEEAKKWYRKRAEVDPVDPEPWYGIATVNWQLAYDETGRTGENVENLSEEKKVEVSQLVEEGITSLQKALELNPQYFEAMEYLNLLYREKAKLAENEEEHDKWRREADKLALQALELKRKQAAEAEAARNQPFQPAP
ncbi:MAG: tetratricopeptide repeat protein [Acidobacteriota bacterium]